jgi:hypothetical protein
VISPSEAANWLQETSKMEAFVKCLEASVSDKQVATEFFNQVKDFEQLAALLPRSYANRLQVLIQSWTILATDLPTQASETALEDSSSSVIPLESQTAVTPKRKASKKKDSQPSKKKNSQPSKPTRGRGGKRKTSKTKASPKKRKAPEDPDPDVEPPKKKRKSSRNDKKKEEDQNGDQPLAQATPVKRKRIPKVQEPSSPTITQPASESNEPSSPDFSQEDDLKSMSPSASASASASAPAPAPAPLPEPAQKPVTTFIVNAPSFCQGFVKPSKRNKTKHDSDLVEGLKLDEVIVRLYRKLGLFSKTTDEELAGAPRDPSIVPDEKLPKIKRAFPLFSRLLKQEIKEQT